ncbi:MAG TPA: polysaccharide biosynthesis/export family protein [Candidatus Angelobacter sp.]
MKYSLKTSVRVGLLLALMHVAVSSPIARAEQDPGKSQPSPTKEMPVAIKIAAGDLLHISVFDVPEMTQEVRVGANGKAQLALIGEIALAGLTGEEAEETIANELRNRKLLVSPQVNVLVKEFSSQGVSVMGEVQHPGIYQVLGSRTLLDLISMAGGLTNVADTRITVKRRGGAQEEVVANLKTDDAKTSLASNVQVYPGDLIVVPRAGIVYVLGDVNRPGGFVMQDSGKITVLEVLAQAGGGSKTASLSKSVLMRKNAQGYVTTKLDLGKIERGQEPDQELHANDVVFVPGNKLKGVLSNTQSIATSIGSASIYAVVH